MNYSEALSYLDSFVNLERNLTRSVRGEIKLDRVVLLASKLGDPQNRFTSLHVAGTKGKGSTCALTASMLAAAGFKTGLYTSPHLQDVRERITINGRMIPEDDFARLLDAARPVLEEMRKPPAGERRPTYFEVLTHLAFAWFADQNADAAVIEVGLGGRLDATNIIRPLACGITNISFDHMAILGDTLPQIARDKAGIIKPGTLAVSAPQTEDVTRTLDECARAAGVALEQAGREIEFSELPGLPSSGGGWPLPQAALRLPDGTAYQAVLGLRGSHQVQNWAVAVRLADWLHLHKTGRHIPHEAVCAGSRGIRWPGRLEELPNAGGARLFADGAHNGHSLRTVLREVRAHLPHLRPAVVLFGCAKDKDWRAMLEVLLHAEAEHVLFTHSGNTRGKDPGELAEAWKTLTGLAAPVFNDCREALAAARDLAGANGLILATGSLYLVGAVKNISQ